MDYVENEAMKRKPARQNLFAELFDLPFDSDWHRQQELHCCIGGPDAMVTYYLSRLQGVNYYRQTLAERNVALQKFIATHFSAQAARSILSNLDWNLPATVLREMFFAERGLPPLAKNKELLAYCEFLKSPVATMAELAKRVGTTEKQLDRMSTLTYAQVCYRRAIAKQRDGTS